MYLYVTLSQAKLRNIHVHTQYHLYIVPIHQHIENAKITINYTMNPLYKKKINFEIVKTTTKHNE